MVNIFKILALLILIIGPVNSYASLIGDTVSVDRRFEDTVLSTITVTVVDPGIESIGWESLLIDFTDYDIIMYPMVTIGYSPVDFNGFDFYDLDFGTENEVISSVNAYYVSVFNHDIIISYLDPTRLDFSDHWISLNLAGSGFGSNPLYISIETGSSPVPLPSTFSLLLLGISMLSIIRLRISRKNKGSTPIRG